MKFGENYKEDGSYFVEIKPGEYLVKIANVTEKKTKTGKPMMELKLVLLSGGYVTYYLVDDQSDEEATKMTNMRLTKFFDCFKIRRGNFNINQWKGATGRVKLDYGKPNNEGHVYIEVKSLLLPSPQTEQGQNGMPQQQNRPSQQQSNMPQNKGGDQRQSLQPERQPERQSTQAQQEPYEKELMQEAIGIGYSLSDDYSVSDDYTGLDEYY